MFVTSKNYNKLKDEFDSFKERVLKGLTVSDKLKPIHTFKFPENVLKKTQQELNLKTDELNSVIIDFFDYMMVVKRYENIEMVSVTTDTLWHNLILDTKAYMDFCLNYVGWFVHHNPHMVKKGLTESEIRDLHQKYKRSIYESNDYVTYRNSEDYNLSLLTFVLLTDTVDTYNKSAALNDSQSTSDNNSTYDSSSNCSSSSCSSSSCSS